MPRNARQTPEGYWVGGAPRATDVADMARAGVRVILSAVVLDEDTRAAARRHGLERVSVWFGNNFPDPDAILSGLEGYAPSEIYIHCEHGGDRAGALLAFLLVVQQGWWPDHALLAVAHPADRDVDGLIAVLESEGFVVTEEERRDLVGIYSGARNGGTGGLKIRGPEYRNLVRTMLAASARLGYPSGDAPPEPVVHDEPAPELVPVASDRFETGLQDLP
jgi:hypothetical protein